MEILKKLLGFKEVPQSPERLAFLRRTQDEFDALGAAGSDVGETLRRAVEAATYRGTAAAQIVNALPADATMSQVQAAEEQVVRLLRPVRQITEHIRSIETLIEQCEPGR